jgi:hypothetical protein
MGGTIRPAEKVLVDEASVGRAVDRREMRMKDEMPSDFNNLELPEITAKKPVYPRACFQNLRILSQCFPDI